MRAFALREAGRTGRDRAVATVAGTRRGSRAEFGAPGSAVRTCTFTKARIRFSNIRESSDTNCPAKWRRPARLLPCRGSKGLRHSLSILRRLRRLPARQDELLSAHRRPRRPYRRRNGRLHLCAGAQCGRGRRRHARSGGDGRVPRDRRARGASRQSAQRRPRSRRRAPVPSAPAA